MTDSSSPHPLADGDIPWPQLFATHRSYLWSVCYRLTGDVQDAEDLVQATFERAMQRPPADRSRPWRPWLTRVASNLAIDLLRRRAQHAYDGPWLPAPVEELLEVEGWTRDRHGGETGELELRYGQLESAQLAFLLALEALEPRPRAVLILRDVLGYSGPEVAEFLDLTPANVRVILHRARKTIDEARAAASSDPDLDRRARDQRTREALERFMTAIIARDADALAALLAEDVCTRSDAGGEFLAARNVVRGRASVVALLMGISRVLPDWAEVRTINGEPGMVAQLGETPLRTARHGVLRVELDASGAIREVQIQLASRKLAAIDFTPTTGP
jgi:RNA polymerase sigma-70 factor (ECF subfamily)